jgi:hypothetical protein
MITSIESRRIIREKLIELGLESGKLVILD